MFWNYLTDILNFTGISDLTVWQDVLLSSFLIPIFIFSTNAILKWWHNKKPLQELLNGFLSEDTSVLVFLAQLSAIDAGGRINHQQQYVVKYANPTPIDKTAIAVTGRINIDPLWSEADGECLADIFNVLGRAGKVKDIEIGDLAKDWGVWSKPTVTIGFNPKSMKLMEKCEPIYFELGENSLSIKGSGTKLDSFMPNDAGILQKTFIKRSSVPILILAGLGTTGTASAGYFFLENSTDIGKLYGSKPFCFLLKTSVDEGKKSVIPISAYPSPSFLRIVLHPLAYLKFKRKSLFNREKA